MKDRGKVLIVGGGVGGLLLAVRLIRSGIPVVVVEKNSRFGGCNSRIDADGTALPLACYSALGLEAGGSIERSLWREATNGDPRPVRMEVSDHLFLPDEDIALPGQLDDFHALLRERHPAEAGSLERFFGTVREVYETIQESFSITSLSRRAAGLAKLRHLHNQRYRDFLEELFEDESLRRLLAIRAFSSTNTVSTMTAYLGKMLIDGLYALPGSGAAVTDRLLAILEQHPDLCTLRGGFEVESLLFDDRPWAVGARSTRGEEIHGDEVVLNVDVGHACHDLIEQSQVHQALTRTIDGFCPGLSALSIVYFTTPDLRRELERFQSTARLFCCQAVDPLAVLAAREQGELDLGYFKVNIDREPPVDAGARLYVEIDCAYGAADFEGMAGREEQALEATVSEVTDRLERVIADFRDGIESLRILTPHHLAALTRNRDGAASGWRDDVAKPYQLERVLGRFGLFQIGQWSFYGSGLSQLELSAAAAHQAIRRRRLRG